jgi:hypothetical protein
MGQLSVGRSGETISRQALSAESFSSNDLGLSPTRYSRVPVPALGVELILGRSVSAAAAAAGECERVAAPVCDSCGSRGKGRRGNGCGSANRRCGGPVVLERLPGRLRPARRERREQRANQQDAGGGHGGP